MVWLSKQFRRGTIETFAMPKQDLLVLSSVWGLGR